MIEALARAAQSRCGPGGPAWCRSRRAPASFSFHEEAVGRLASGVSEYERQAALVAWRYTAAALVLSCGAAGHIFLGWVRLV